MRHLTLGAITLCLSFSAVAQHTYIVPVTALRIVGPDRIFESRTSAINLGSAPVEITAHTYSSSPLTTPCVFKASVTPGDQGNFGVPSDDYIPCSGKLFTLVFDSPEPLMVRSRVESNTFGSNCAIQNIQEIPVATSWLPPNRDVVIRQFERDPLPPGARANLFVTNPNASPISVAITITRGLSVSNATIDVAPESLRVWPVPEILEGACGVSPCPFAYRATLRSNGTFLAGISTAYAEGGEWYSAAVVLPQSN